MQDVYFGNSLRCADSGTSEEYLCHALCIEGSCSFRFNGKEYLFAAGDCLIVRRSTLIDEVKESGDFKAEVVYASPRFITLSIPQSNYGTRGGISLYNNPIMHLNGEQQRRCASDFECIRQRLGDIGHKFYRDALMNAVQAMIIDFFDFHASIYGFKDSVTQQHSRLMNRFLALLERGDYKEHREISHYADILCVTPKYLSEISKKVSGFPAGYWITRYTTTDIMRQLRSKQLSISEISEMFGFSSDSYFSRYVLKYLGAPPSDFTE